MKRMGLVIALAFVAVVGGGSTTQALSNDPKMFISADNTFYAYVKGGEKISASFDRVNQHEPFDTVRGDVTVTLDGPQFTQQTCVLKKDVAFGQGCSFAPVTATKTGIWRINFVVPEGSKTYPEVSPVVRWAKNWFNWNITVSGSDGEKQGRIWTERYAIRQPAPVEFSTDITNYYISEDGYIYRAVTKGYNGQISTLSADSIGIRKGTECTSAYQSADVNNANKLAPALGACGNAYKLFFEEPAGDLPTKARNWENKEEWVRPNINRPTISELHFESDKSQDQQSGTISFYLKNFIGQYQIKIDVDNNGDFDGQNDVVLNQQMKKLTTAIQRVKFQGVDRRGQIIMPSQKIGIKVNITKVAEIHLVAADVEGRSGGLELVRLNGDNAPTNRICWNDTEIAELTEDLTPDTLDGRSCQVSEGGLHEWVYGDGSWGNARYIDDWVYASAKLVGDNMITFPDTTEEEAAATRQNWILIGSVIGGIIIAGVIAFVLVSRRKKKQASQFPQAPGQPVAPNSTDTTNSGQPPDPNRY
jgi:hypothetical protein